MSEAAIEDILLANLKQAAEELDKLNEELNDPNLARDLARMAQLGREHSRLRKLVEPYHEYNRLTAQIADNEEIANDPDQDAELREMATEEMVELRATRDGIMEQIKDAVAAGDEGEVGSIIMEMRAGTGGDEAALFVGDLFEMYRRYCERNRLKLEVMSSSGSEQGGFKEITINIKGEGVYRRLGFEGGGHRVQRVPKTESQGRIHTSAATVAVLPEPEAIDVQIDWERDVVEHVSRAGGPGGQNVNKVSSAIRLEHTETGITVSMRDEKSQHKNREKARRIMLSRVYEHHASRDQAQRDQARKTMIGSGDRSDRVRTYNFPQNRCTDHRINLDIYNLAGILDGDLDDLITALQAHDREMRLSSL